MYLSFNQNYTCFACGTNDGFRIYNCNPLQERFKREIVGGVVIIEMLYRSNIHALVGDGSRYPSNMVMLWDDYQGKCIAELEFNSQVRAVRLRRETIVIILADRVFIYNFADLRLMAQIDTYPNYRGTAALSSGKNAVLAFPGIDQGTVTIVLTSINKTHTIKAHTGAIACIGMSRNGDLLATASDKGTIIRLWDSESGKQLRELRRGVDQAEIWSLVFNNDATQLIASSNKGTAHIYVLNSKQNRKSSLAWYISGNYLPAYFNSEWSMTSFPIPTEAICAFSGDGTIVVLSRAGIYYKYKRDKHEKYSIVERVNLMELK